MMRDTKIVFLHIPKTAGQSVHHFLQKVVGESNVSPIRVNRQLHFKPIVEVKKYQLVSGHLDWNLLDCVPTPKFVFTVLRDPSDRILSFYFYLRKQAAALNVEELDLPENQGMRAILRLSCDDYFVGGSPNVRNFLDNHYDNFYAYYFAGRSYTSRQFWRAQQRVDPSLTDHQIIDIATSNLATLDGVYTVDTLDRLQRDIERIFGPVPGVQRLDEVRVNASNDAAGSRTRALEALGATSKTFDRIEMMTSMDNKIWKRFHNRQRDLQESLELQH